MLAYTRGVRCATPTTIYLVSVLVDHRHVGHRHHRTDLQHPRQAFLPAWDAALIIAAVHAANLMLLFDSAGP
ncbi:MAG: hypothetical protein IPL36_13140 [Nigerium sp.]|nr:hypothetical protein [Nigerium sp.]